MTNTIMRKATFAGFLCIMSSAANAQALTPVGRLLIEAECKAIETEFVTALDDNDSNRVAALFGTSGEMWLTASSFKGEAAIKAYMEKRDAQKTEIGVATTRHMVFNVKVNVIDRDHASGTGYIAVYRYDGRNPQDITSLAPQMVGRMQDNYVRTAQGWRYQSRKLTQAGISAN